jgi:lipooligosaccharide transport system permease protein
MSNAAVIEKIHTIPPSLVTRVYSVWFRHYRVYTKNLFSNGFPPFMEPLFFLAGIGLGLGQYVGIIDGTSYVYFLAAGMIAPSAMFTASFECTFGTFIRMEFDKVYDGMIAASLTVKDVFVGEMLFCGTKGLFFSFAVMSVLYLFGLITSPLGLLTPVGGFFTGMMFSALALYITSWVKNINHFNFFFTGLLTPMFFFSGIVFPLSTLPKVLQWTAELFPLTHSVRIMRALCFARIEWVLLPSVLYIILFTVLFGYLSIRRLEKRIIA